MPRRCAKALRASQDALPRLGKIPLGGTAVGTGLNTHPEFAERVRKILAQETGLTISAPADPFEAQAARDGIVEASGALKTVAVSLTKIANDIRFLGSGPRAGLAEIALPELQKGSSIMPGKVNPVIPEVVTQVAAQVIGNDTAIAVGGMQGHFELNVFVPLLARNILDSVKLLASASRLFAEKCVDGIEANRENAERYAELTLSAATALNPYIGYDRASEIVKEAAARAGRSARSRGRRASTRRYSTRPWTTGQWQSRTDKLNTRLPPEGGYGFHRRFLRCTMRRSSILRRRKGKEGFGEASAVCGVASARGGIVRCVGGVGCHDAPGGSPPTSFAPLSTLVRESVDAFVCPNGGLCYCPSALQQAYDFPDRPGRSHRRRPDDRHRHGVRRARHPVRPRELRCIHRHP